MTHVAEQPRVGPRWFPLNVWSALALATVLGLLTFLLTSTGESVTQTAEGESAAVVELSATDEPAATNSSAAEETGSDAAVGTAAAEQPAAVESSLAALGSDTEAAAGIPLVARAGAITNMGPTEVGYVTNFPSVGYTWQRVELPGAGLMETGWLGELNGQVVSVTPGWGDESEQTQSLVTRSSSDAIDWETVGSYELPAETWVSRIASSNGLVVAFAEHWGAGAGQAEHLLLTTNDGITWTESTLSLGAAADENVYIQDMVMGDAGIAISAQYDSHPEEQALTLVFESYEVILDHMRGTFSLVESASGDVVLTGSTDELFNWGSNGQNIYNPDTNELLVTIPYEIWEQAYNGFYSGTPGGSPLPIPIQTGEPSGEPLITIEYEGFVVTVDEMDDTYTVTDADSGAELVAATLDYLYQGIPPTFEDPDSGEVLLAVSWDEWYQAEEQSYMSIEYGEEYYLHRSRTALLTSTDLATWSTQTVSEGQGGSATYLAATADGFVAMINSYSEGGERSRVWTMSGGQWTSTDTERSDLWLHQVATTADGLVGVGDGSGGPALWSSPDGISWDSEFAILPQSDGSHAWLSDVATDGAGTLATLAIREKYSEYTPLIIEQATYTAMFEDGDTVLRVTDTASGETVLSLGWEAFDNGSAADVVTYADGATSIDLGNGDVMVITDDEAYSAMETRYSERGQLGLSVFLNDGTGWAEAVVEVEGVIDGASQLFLADERVIIGGSYWGMEHSYYYEERSQGAFVILVGTPAGG
ncbi:MAG: hypothetical protein GY926_10030 [bacterium]|nr:hypothetical protein [bacterium]